MEIRVWRFSDNINTDDIIPARYLNTSSPAELSKHCFEDLCPEFSKEVKKGDIIVAGENFGCGSSREHAPLAIKNSGISFVIAQSFARIFFRNCINIGLPIGEIPNALALTDEEIVEKARQIRLSYPDFLQRIIEKGGLMRLVEEVNKRTKF